jgi:ribonuclease BN (tRNA processing enzyme)
VRITFLGSGGAFTDFRVNYHNNALVYTGEGPVLLDCGLTAVQSMRELGIPPWGVHTVLVTHLHPDHASPGQLAVERYYGGPDDRPGLLRTRIAAPADVLHPLVGALVPYLDEYPGPDGGLRRGGTEALIDASEGGQFEVGGVRFRYFRVPHVTGGTVDKPAYGLEIDDGRSRVLWSGDTTLSLAWLAKAASDSRVVRVFHDCTFTPRRRGAVHTHWEELVALDPALTERVTLMHHTAVPPGLELGRFAGAAARHEVFEV